MRKRILFIADEKDQISVVKKRLESVDYGVITAMSGQEGIDMIGSEKPDLILLDVVLPDMYGYEVCQRIKEDAESKHIPIIIITAAGDKDLEDKVKESKADGLIKKPYEPEDLLNKVKSLLKK